jgi:uncharacterized protein YndB with AHSA1/START domain
MSREFEIRREVELHATPEQVWEAVATGAGNAAWMFPNEVPSGEGAKGADGTTVTAWDPPHRFAVRTEGPDWFNALEFVIEGRDGAPTTLRYAHSGIIVDDWDNQYDAAAQHTDFYLHTLGEYLEHFGGRPVTYVGEAPGGIDAPAASATPDGFQALQRALGLADDAREGDTVRLQPRSLEPIEGVLDYRRPNFVGIRTDDALYRFFGRNAFGMPVGLSIHAFGDGVDAQVTRQAWERWLQGVYV